MFRFVTKRIEFTQRPEITNMKYMEGIYKMLRGLNRSHDAFDQVVAVKSHGECITRDEGGLYVYRESWLYLYG